MRTSHDRLRRVADLSGLGRAPLSRLAGLGQSTLQMALRAPTRDPSLRVLSAVADVTGVSLEWLALGRGVPPTPAGVRAAIARWAVAQAARAA